MRFLILLVVTVCRAFTGVVFGVNIVAKRKVTVTTKRRNRLHELRSMPYRDYLKTPEWDKTRKAAYRRANHTCQRCRRTGVMLNVHHKTYDNLGREPAKDLIVLCCYCHKKIHNI